jgi:hypothetical protein
LSWDSENYQFWVRKGGGWNKVLETFYNPCTHTPPPHPAPPRLKAYGEPNQHLFF